MKRVHEAMKRHVAAKNAPGIVTAVSHRGRIDVNAIGDLAFDGKPMDRDAIFRIASITKVVLAAAALSLVEDLVGVLLAQRAGPPNRSPIYRDFWALVYGGLDG